MHGCDALSTRFLCGSELADVEYLKEAAAGFPSPLPLSVTKNYLERQVQGSENEQ